MFFSDRSGGELMRRGGFVDGAISMTDTVSDQPGLWQERVLLNEEFYRALCEHPVPVSESALRHRPTLNGHRHLHLAGLSATRAEA
jgi:hypothetical protein